MLLALTMLTILVAFNALYVAAEFAAVSVRKSRIHQQAAAGNRLARAFLPYVEDGHALDRYVATCQVGITFTSLLVGAYGTRALRPMLSPLFVEWGGMQEAAATSAAATVVLVGLTAFQMILGELVPKSLALQYPTPVALYTVIPLKWSMAALAWFIKVLNGSGLAVLRVFGVEPTGHVHIHAPGEIEYLIAESRRGGLLDDEEHGRLREALRLSVTQVTEVMVPRTEMIAIPASASPADALAVARVNHYSRFPVHSDSLDEIVGYVHVQDLARVALNESTELPRRHLIVVPATATVEQTLQTLRKEHKHMALVVDEFGGTAGLVTLGDILEDIFGGISDEFKEAETGIEQLSDGRYRIPGWLRVVELEDLLGLEFETHATTVGGLVMEHLGQVPSAGQRAEILGTLFQVEAMEGRRIAHVVLSPAPTPNAEARDE